MNLRQRIVLTLLVITAVLVVPALVGLFSLRQVAGITAALRTRDTEATQALGQLRTTVQELQSAQDNFVVLRFTSPDTANIWRSSTRTAQARGDSLVAVLGQRQHSGTRYRTAAGAAAESWQRVKRAVAAEQLLLDSARTDSAGSFRKGEVRPAFAAMERAIDPVNAAISGEAAERVRQAASIANNAATGALLALALALLLTVVIGSLMTRALLRPIAALRVGMARVAEGDFEPDVHVPLERPDEIGDLSRSFATMTAQLAELDRLKAEFVSVASHEIKTPLSVIRGYVSLLADGIYGEVNERQRKTLEAVSDQTDRLTRLVHRLLDISRFEAGGGRLEIRRINVRDFLEELTVGFRVLAFQNGIDFDVTVADDTPVNIEGDADRLNEVLGNLLSNAFKFTARGGRIRLQARREGTGVQVEVSDTGVGIPPDKLPKIFEKFYQVDNPAQPRSAGSGLGLAIAREIVEAHGGMIGAESEVGKGTTFRVTLPERPPALRTAEPHPAPARR